MLQNALHFRDGLFRPIDYIETKYEASNENKVIPLKLIEEAESVGARKAGSPIRVKMINLLKMTDDSRIQVDFSGLTVVSSSFADEVFGKLYIETGAQTFLNRIEFSSMTQNVKMIVDRAIRQRKEQEAVKSK